MSYVESIVQIPIMDPQPCGPCFQGRLDDTDNPFAAQAPCCVVQQAEVPAIEAGRFSIHVQTEESISEVLSILNPNCDNSLNSPGAFSGSGFHDENGNTDAVNFMRGVVSDALNGLNSSACADSCNSNWTHPACLGGRCVVPTCTELAAEGLCNDETLAGVRMRSFCAASCGCDWPFSSLVLDQPQSGCPGNCKEKFQSYLVDGVTYRCDHETWSGAGDMDHRTGAFKAYLDALQRIQTTFPDTVEMIAAAQFSHVQALGCAAVGLLGLCFTEGLAPLPIKELAYYCPTTCGCTEARREEGTAPAECTFYCGKTPT